MTAMDFSELNPPEGYTRQHRAGWRAGQKGKTAKDCPYEYRTWEWAGFDHNSKPTNNLKRLWWLAGLKGFQSARSKAKRKAKKFEEETVALNKEIEMFATLAEEIGL